MSAKELERDSAILKRLMEALTDHAPDGLRPIDWTATLVSISCIDDIHQQRDADYLAWSEMVQQVGAMVRTVRLIISAYRDSLPVAVAVQESDLADDEEIPF